MRTFIACLALALAADAAAAGDTPLARAMVELRADNWQAARAQAAPAGQVALDIVEWRRLRAGEGTFADYVAFLSRNGDWPGLDRLHMQAEGKIPPDVDPAAVLAFFANRRPVTGLGALRLVQAHAALGNSGDAQALAVLAWRTLPLGAEAHAAFLARFAPALSVHHEARIDAMLWAGEAAEVRRMLPLVAGGWAALADARLALRAGAAGVDALIAAVPASLADHPGLARERFLWRAQKGRAEDAIALIEAHSLSAETLGRPEEWANWRRIYARKLMREGEGARAYRLAARHHIPPGSDYAYADLEWLAGFIALRQLDDPATALTHFTRFEAVVETPISLSRGGYWRGRALEAMGRPDEARAAYAGAAAHQTAFYGQLAAERAGLPMDPALAGGETYPGWRDAPWANGSVLRAALMFHEAGERNLVEWFLTHLADSADPIGQRKLAGLALRLDEPHIALRLAKLAAGDGNVMIDAYFPLSGLARADHPVATELVLAVARRESEFDPSVVSGAGARGLMQLMPGTAQAMAAKLGLAYSEAALTRDPDYNARLGAAYLAQLVEEFGPNPVLVAAAYNAGPSRARAWITERGDPRSAGVDVVDWIEMIPFRETRNYVMRVSESLAIYRARLSGRPEPLRLSAELKSD
ncbi:soluble lytic murein transglycosylase [Rhodovulum bhavnagarense]|uniref:Soluble lytic murein transglycosylase n=1 Tax=Rhodovulum bhavnagarense TaxID=992286 RepID=A0A4R2RHN0_9RHOB|nr:lytic transglycosylase domain-containing protein [Rhodovulum bhavnagarense]TCP58685.1 soluble lytic murein transglycosylase [Rhodovulum bhavnagarense]